MSLRNLPRDTSSLRLVVGVVVRLQHRQHDRIRGWLPRRWKHSRWQRHKPSGCIGKVHHRVVEELTQALAGQDP